MLLEEIEKLKTEREEIYSESESHKRKVRQYKEAEMRLLGEIEDLGNFKVQLEESKMENVEMKNKL